MNLQKIGGERGNRKFGDTWNGASTSVGRVHGGSCFSRTVPGMRDMGFVCVSVCAQFWWVLTVHICTVGKEICEDEGDVSSSGPLQNETANIAVPKVLSVVADPLADEAESSPIITPRPADRTVAPLEQSEQDFS